MPVSAVVLMTGAPSAAYAQCIGGTFGNLPDITSAISTVNTAFVPSGSAFLSAAPSSAPDQQGGGVWTRAVAGKVDTASNTNINASIAVTQPNGLGFPITLSAPCRATAKQSFEGFEVGHDIALLNSGNSDMNWHFGVLAGYVGVNVNTPQEGEVPAQSGNIVAPSAGFYTAFSKGNFSADVQARLYELEAASVGQRLDARGYSVAGNVGYRFDLPGNWSLEPSAGAIFSRTGIDPLTIAAVPFPVGPTAFVPLSGALEFQDVESLLGRASLTLGTSLPLGPIVAYPFVSASVFHEFEGNVTATIAINPALPIQGSGTLTTGGIGTYGQFGGGSAFVLPDTGWLGFARVDYRTGENIQGYQFIAGLRYQFEADNSARYPEMPVKAARPPQGYAYDWTGPYVGVSVGAAWGGMHWTSQAGSADPDYAGYLAGGQAGYNYQTGRFVWGIETDAGTSNARGAASGCPILPPLFGCEADVGFLGSLTGRFGYTLGRALFYAKGGWEYAEVTAGTNLNFVDPALGIPPAPGAMKSTNWENGWTAGVGMEYALTDSWSAKAEYMHYGFPQSAFAVAQNTTANATTEGNIVRIGVNYHFKP